MRNKILIFMVFILEGAVFHGCVSSDSKDHLWVSRSAPMEAEWIRNGEPIEFEGESWYPQDAIENLLDSEVYFVGEQKEAQFFVEFTDVRPYDRLYTRFTKNKYRVFEQKARHD